jgi:hypothetical protein
MVVVMAARREKKEKEASTTTSPEPGEFTWAMEELEVCSPGRLDPRMRPWYLRRYYENPAGFMATAEECWEGRNPLGLFHHKLTVGLHLEVPPRPLALVGPAAEEEEPEPASSVFTDRVCPECSVGGGRHVVDCSLAGLSEEARRKVGLDDGPKAA